MEYAGSCMREIQQLVGVNIIIKVQSHYLLPQKLINVHIMQHHNNKVLRVKSIQQGLKT